MSKQPDTFGIKQCVGFITAEQRRTHIGVIQRKSTKNTGNWKKGKDTHIDAKISLQQETYTPNKTDLVLL